MPSYYGDREGSITNHEILETYRVTYQSVYKVPPKDCGILDNNQFQIAGKVHDRRWVLLEIERLRQEALTQLLDAKTPFIRVRKLRRLSDI